MRRSALRAAGFTIAEVIIVVGIIGFLTTVVVARYRDFDSATVLHNLAYEVALSVREAQVMAISTSNIGSTNPNWRSSYGIAFDANSNTYTLFSDLDNDGVYDSGEMIKLVTISQGAQIADLHMVSPDDTVYAVTAAAVTFTRPHLETSFVTDQNFGSVAELIVTVTSSRGGSRTIHVSRSGRISVE